jgi:catechol 2,3-dioxygenase-like lactoylglutathione lyase family enzyme
MKLSYVIKFVGDIDHAVKFYRDTLGLVDDQEPFQ